MNRRLFAAALIGGFAGGLFSFGGKGLAGGNAGEVYVSSSGALQTSSDDAAGIFAQSVGGGGGSGSGSGGLVAIGGSGSTGGNGGSVTVTSVGENSVTTTIANSSAGSTCSARRVESSRPAESSCSEATSLLARAAWMSLRGPKPMAVTR